MTKSSMVIGTRQIKRPGTNRCVYTWRLGPTVNNSVPLARLLGATTEGNGACPVCHQADLRIFMVQTGKSARPTRM